LKLRTNIHNKYNNCLFTNR